MVLMSPTRSRSSGSPTLHPREAQQQRRPAGHAGSTERSTPTGGAAAVRALLRAADDDLMVRPRTTHTQSTTNSRERKQNPSVSSSRTCRGNGHSHRRSRHPRDYSPMSLGDGLDDDDSTSHLSKKKTAGQQTAPVPHRHHGIELVDRLERENNLLRQELQAHRVAEQRRTAERLAADDGCGKRHQEGDNAGAVLISGDESGGGSLRQRQDKEKPYVSKSFTMYGHDTSSRSHGGGANGGGGPKRRATSSSSGRHHRQQQSAAGGLFCDSCGGVGAGAQAAKVDVHTQHDSGKEQAVQCAIKKRVLPSGEVVTLMNDSDDSDLLLHSQRHQRATAQQVDSSTSPLKNQGNRRQSLERGSSQQQQGLPQNTSAAIRVVLRDVLFEVMRDGASNAAAETVGLGVGGTGRSSSFQLADSDHDIRRLMVAILDTADALKKKAAAAVEDRVQMQHIIDTYGAGGNGGGRNQQQGQHRLWKTATPSGRSGRARHAAASGGMGMRMMMSSHPQSQQQGGGEDLFAGSSREALGLGAVSSTYPLADAPSSFVDPAVSPGRFYASSEGPLSVTSNQHHMMMNHSSGGVPVSYSAASSPGRSGVHYRSVMSSPSKSTRSSPRRSSPAVAAARASAAAAAVRIGQLQDQHSPPRRQLHHQADEQYLLQVQEQQQDEAESNLRRVNTAAPNDAHMMMAAERHAASTPPRQQRSGGGVGGVQAKSISPPRSGASTRSPTSAGGTTTQAQPQRQQQQRQPPEVSSVNLSALSSVVQQPPTAATIEQPQDGNRQPTIEQQEQRPTSASSAAGGGGHNHQPAGAVGGAATLKPLSMAQLLLSSPSAASGAGATPATAGSEAAAVHPPSTTSQEGPTAGGVDGAQGVDALRGDSELADYLRFKEDFLRSLDTPASASASAAASAPNTPA